MSASRGFTLVELLVVCAIIVIITSVILVDNNKFGGQVILENLAYDVALSVRQAQVYGIAVERFGASNFGYGYGMDFALSDASHYYLFADTDIPPSGLFHPGQVPSQIVRATTIQQGYSIYGLCVVPLVNGATCTPVTEISILYLRPEPNAFISSGGDGVVGHSYTMTSCARTLSSCSYEAQITLRSPRGATSTVVVDDTGQISVQ